MIAQKFLLHVASFKSQAQPKHAAGDALQLIEYTLLYDADAYIQDASEEVNSKCGALHGAHFGSASRNAGAWETVTASSRAALSPFEATLSRTCRGCT